MKAFFRYSVLASLLATVCAIASANEPYPSRPIKVIVPYTPGQGADSAARLVGAKLAERLKQPLVMENRPGAAGNIGAEIAAKAPADGYTLLVGSNATHAANAALYASLRFDPLKDFVGISYIGAVPMALVVAPGFPVSNVRDLLQLAKTQPGALSVATLLGDAADATFINESVRSTPASRGRNLGISAAPPPHAAST